MAGGSKLNKIGFFMSNILWINLKRLGHQFMWRILILFINTMFFFIFSFNLVDFIYTYVFLIVLSANILFVITRVQSEKDSVMLLRSLGASKVFIVFDHMFQILLQVFIAFLIFILAIPALFLLIKYIPLKPFYFFLVKIFIIAIFSSIYSFKTINSLEKEANL